MSVRMEVDFGIWGVVKKVAVMVFVIACLCGLALWYVPVIRQTATLQKEIEIRREALRKQEEIQQRYTEEILAMRTDPEAVERAVRQNLKLVKPNEVIYHFESGKSPGK